MAIRDHRAGSVLDTAGGIDTGAGELFGTLDALEPQYHVRLGGVGLMLAPGGYGKAAANQLAAQIATAGLSNSNRITDQAVELTNWHGGESSYLASHFIHEPESPDRYREGAGIDPFTLEGALGLGPHLATIQSTTYNAITAMRSFRGKLYVGFGNGDVRTWDGATWSGVHHATGKAGGIRSFEVHTNYLHYGTGTDGVVFATDGTTPTTAFTVATFPGGAAVSNVRGVRAMAIHYQEGVPTPYWAATVDATDTRPWAQVGTFLAVGGGTTTSGEVKFTSVFERIDVMISTQGKLIVMATTEADRRCAVFEGDATATIGWDARGEFPGIVPRCAAVLGNDLYVGDAYDGKIWRWTGDGFVLVNQLGTDLVPYTAEITSMAAWRGGLWVGILDTDGTPALLRFDGNQSWSRPVAGLAETSPGPLFVFLNQLYYGTSKTGASVVRATNGTFRASGSVESGLIDAELRATNKLWSQVAIRHSALASGQSVEVQYKLEDSGSWVSLGTSSTVGATTATFDFANGITSDLIAFKILLAGSAGSSTALQVFSVVASYKPAPGVKREWDLTAQFYGNAGRHVVLLDGSEDPLTGSEVSALIWELMDANEPVLYLDLDRQMYTVQLVEFSEDLASTSQVGSPGLGWETEGKLKIRER